VDLKSLLGSKIRLRFIEIMAPKKKPAAKAKKPKKKKSNAGRPTRYKKEYVEQAYKLCLLGLVDDELSEYFGVSEVTLNAWKKRHPEFLKSVMEGKEIADANVAKSLYERAVGYEHPEVHISTYQGKVIQTELTKHYPPDTAAAVHFLNNRQRHKWKSRVDNTHSDPDGGPIQTITRIIVDPKESNDKT
jgi:hypothetical protein